MWSTGGSSGGRGLNPVPLDEMVRYVRSHTGFQGRIAVVLGSGLGAFTEGLSHSRVIPYASIPNFPLPTVEGHRGELVSGVLNDIPLLVARGRFHRYEGHSLENVTLPMRLFHALGVRRVIITNAAGSLKPEFTPGSLLLITGHLDCTFQEHPQQPQPITAPPYYVPDLLEIARRSAREAGITLREGIYCWTLGPAYETPDEIHYFQSLGGAAVGMSTVPEISWAGPHGMEPLAISMLTNFAAGLSATPLTHEEVIETANRMKVSFLHFLTRVIQNIEGRP